MTTSLLALLQLGDSLFPAGGFAHSYGLEQLAREGLVADAAGVEAFVESVLRQCVATADAPAASRAALALSDGDLDALVAVDRALERSRAAAELRAASRLTGRRLLEETTLHLDSADLEAYRQRVRAGQAPGHHAVAFGAVSSVCGVAPAEVAAALLFVTANGLLQASLRLLPVSHRDAQATLHRLRPLIASLAADAGVEAPLRAIHPLQEIASMRHAAAEVRLFQS